jgi:predicted nucleotidyltransferase
LQPVWPDGLRLTVKRTVDLLNDAGVDAVIIGGIAASALGHGRLTDDVDATALLDNDSLDTFLEIANARGFVPRHAGGPEFARESRMVLLTDSTTGVGVDISMAGLPLEVEVISRGIDVDLTGIRVRVASAEDLMIMKAVAARPKDHQDILDLLRSNPQADLARVRRYLPEFAEALDRPEIVTDFEALVRQAAR